MKKIFEFIKNNVAEILVIFTASVIIGCLALPFFIAIGRIMWDIAINNPTAIM